MVEQLCLSCGAFCDPLYITCPECGSYNLLTEDEYDSIVEPHSYIDPDEQYLTDESENDDNE